MNSSDISGSSKLISFEFNIKQERNAVISAIFNLFKIFENNNSVTIKQSQHVISLAAFPYNVKLFSSSIYPIFFNISILN